MPPALRLSLFLLFAMVLGYFAYQQIWRGREAQRPSDGRARPQKPGQEPPREIQRRRRGLSLFSGKSSRSAIARAENPFIAATCGNRQIASYIML